jgi:hypothetical protein
MLAHAESSALHAWMTMSCIETHAELHQRRLNLAHAESSALHAWMTMPCIETHAELHQRRLNLAQDALAPGG